MKIGELISFTFEDNHFQGIFLEEQLSMFPEYIEANQNQIRLEIQDPAMRKQLKLGRKKTVIIDKNMIIPKKKYKIS